MLGTKIYMDDSKVLAVGQVWDTPFYSAETTPSSITVAAEIYYDVAPARNVAAAIAAPDLAGTVKGVMTDLWNRWM